MKLFLINILLAISWSALTGNASLTNFLLGFAIGYGAIALSPVPQGSGDYFRRLPRILSLLIFFLRELVVSGMRTTREVLSPLRRSCPQVIRVATGLREHNQLLLLSQLVSLTPGTLVLDISPEADALYVHTMFVTDAEIFRCEIRDGLEKRIREAFD
ncbi:Na+/H+ antiporter subunit E [Microbulbifer hainanensis]|uniref:Na+/H+ antiporter subunit E n=1 Tax=Microbulbifer hainanensis TaxID=2735675 RepID=UPI001868C053|nr:Na+/H+ antiporter subunit E [Microbulbifer hainanensis]